MPTYSPKASEITRAWHVVDAEGMVLGRLATEVARSSAASTSRPTPRTWTPATSSSSSTPTRSCSPRARLDTKLVRHHTGYPGGLKTRTYGEVLGQARRRRSAAPSRACSRRTASAPR